MVVVMVVKGALCGSAAEPRGSGGGGGGEGGAMWVAGVGSGVASHFHLCSPCHPLGGGTFAGPICVRSVPGEGEGAGEGEGEGKGQG